MQKADNLLFARSGPFKLLLEKSFGGKKTMKKPGRAESFSYTMTDSPN